MESLHVTTDITRQEERWWNYRRANSEKKHVRQNELNKLLRVLNAAEGEKIWEVGTGGGYVTFPLAKKS